MYTEADRHKLLNDIVQMMYSAGEFEGLLQIGSGATGYKDIYSDIDLMAGCGEFVNLEEAEKKLMCFFNGLEPIYIDRRKWAETILGLSVYFENGLSVDLSYMPTDEIRLRSPYWKILFSKTVHFSDVVKNDSHMSCVTLDDSVHHKFVYALRRCEIAIYRSEFLYAEIALAEARQILLMVEAAREGKKLHQFKSFDSLGAGFLERLSETYPSLRNFDNLRKAKDALLALYLDVVKHCDFLTFNEDQLKLLNRFE